MKTRFELIEDFLKCYSKVYDKNNQIIACGRNACKDLMLSANRLDKNTNFGDLSTGFLDEKEIKYFHSRILFEYNTSNRLSKEELVHRFNSTYNEVFNAEGNITACGRETCRKLMNYAQILDIDTDYGDMSTGRMNIDNIKKLNITINN